VKGKTRNTNKKYKKICDSVNDPIIMIDSKEIVTYWNRAAKKMFGYRSEDIVGKRMSSLIIPRRFRKLFRRGFTQFKNSKRRITAGNTFELTAIGKNGKEFPVEVSFSKVKIEGTWNAIGTIRDITDRKRAEQALKIKGHALASSINAIIFTDLNGRLKYGNDSFLTMWGYRNMKEIVRQHSSHFWEKEEKFNRILKKLKKEGGWIGELKGMKKDGSLFEVQVSASMVKDSEGNPLCMMATFIDITERIKAEKALRESEEKFRTVVEKAGDIAYVMDANASLTYIGPQVEKYGFRTKNLLNRNFIDIIYEDDRRNMWNKFQDAINNGTENISTFRVDTPSRGIRFFEESGKLLKNGQGRYIGLAGIIRDVTNHKQAEEELRKKAKEARFLSFIDDLTGLYNRRGFFNFAEQYLKLAQRTKRELLVVYADVDQLKEINDTFGHKVGSLALIDTGNILKETFRASDVLARIGGDEFVILALETSGTSTQSIANRFKSNLKKHNRRRNRPYKYTLSISLGIARYDPKNPCSLDELLDRADRLMYKEKKHKKSFSSRLYEKRQ
jgi:diguanylate cyclase (GGDEF)-like protein/PAS domain S-box-containing protein